MQVFSKFYWHYRCRLSYILRVMKRDLQSAQAKIAIEGEVMGAYNAPAAGMNLIRAAYQTMDSLTIATRQNKIIAVQREAVTPDEKPTSSFSIHI